MDPILTRRALLASLLAGTALPALADSYPSRPIRLVVGFAPGGPVDTAARVYAETLAKVLGQAVLVDNRSGASGIIGAAQVLRSAPDGYTLYFGASSTLTMAPWMQKTTAFDPVADFTDIGLVALYANVMLVRAEGRFKSLQEVVDFARQHPGGVSYGSAGVGTAGHLSAEFLCQKAGVRMTHVPYRRNAPALADLMGGQIDFLFDFVGTAVAQVQGGRVRAIAVTSATRNAALPDVPTVAESGYNDYAVTGWLALLGPAALPAEVGGKLMAAHLQVVNGDEFRAQFRRNGYEAADPAPAVLRERIVREQVLWGNVIKAAGIQPE